MKYLNREVAIHEWGGVVDLDNELRVDRRPQSVYLDSSPPVDEPVVQDELVPFEVSGCEQTPTGVDDALPESPPPLLFGGRVQIEG